jgi:tRNA threonylcarbamoyladenosine biosynthesis protein TsaB
MLTLALDTSTREGSVALGGTGDVFGELTLSVRATHSETVLPAIDRLLSEVGWSVRDLGAVVVGAGPGSFTGVRIAAALARGICFPTGADLFAYSSLAAIAANAANAGAEGRICALLDARRDQVYAAGYRLSSGFEELFAPLAAPLEEVLAGLEPETWTVAGVLPVSARERIAQSNARLLAPAHGRPRASALLRLARMWPEAGRVAEPARWEPTYVRTSSAERRIGDV